MVYGYIFLAAAILFEIVGTLSLKMTNGFTKLIPTLVTCVAYTVSFYFLSVTLKTFTIGFAYAVWSGVGLALISILSTIIYKEPFDFIGAVGITFIIIGVVILNQYSSMSGH